MQFFDKNLDKVFSFGFNPSLQHEKCPTEPHKLDKYVVSLIWDELFYFTAN